MSSPGLTVTELCARFLAQHTASEARIELLTHMLGKARSALGDVSIEQLQPEEIAAWRASLAPPTRWQATQALSQVTAWALSWKLIAEDPVARVANPRPPRTEFTPFADWDAIEVLANALPSQLRLLPWLGAGCGLRPGELLGLSWDCIGVAREELTVRRTAWRGQLRSTLKTGRSKRIVPIRARVREQLEQVPRAERSGLVFASTVGTPLDLHNLRARAWRPALGRAGLESSHRIYDLRHTYASWSLRAGVSIFQLARRMGTSVGMIDATYGHLSADAADYERRLLDAWDGV
jgi:integrase